MKAPNQNLFQLIQSLNKQERIFYRRNFQNNTIENQPPLYLQLFDTIAKQQEYDESAILNSLKPNVNKANISYLKNYLYEDLCNALIELTSRKDKRANFYKEILLIRVLRGKNLFQQAKKIAEKLLLVHYDSNHLIIYQELLYEYRLLLWYETPNISYKNLENSLELFNQLIDSFSKEAKIQHLYFEALLLKRKTHFKQNENDKEQIALLEKQLKSFTLSADDSFFYHHYYYTTHAILCYIQHDSKANVYTYTCIQMWLKHEEYLQSDTEKYIELMYAYIYTAIMAGAYQQLITTLNHPAHDAINNSTKYNTFETIKYLGLNRAYNKLGNYDKVATLLTNIKQRENECKNCVWTEMNVTLYLSIGISCFVLEQHDDAFYYIKNASHQFDNQTRKEHLSFAFLFLLVICIEKKDYALFEIQYNSTYSFFYRKEAPLPFEKAIMQALRKVALLINEEEKILLYENLYHSLLKTKDNTIQQDVFSIFNFPLWIKSKIDKILYRKLVIQELTQL